MSRQMIAQQGQGEQSNELPVHCLAAAQKLVAITLRHRRYRKYYTFPSNAQGWVMTDQIRENDSTKPENMLSIYCKMVICEGGQKEVVHVSVLNGNCKVMLSMPVKPEKFVVDYLTATTGVSEADLEDVASNIVDAQEAVLGLLTSNTILVGHCLYHHLRALKIDHLRVIDTSFIFQYQNKNDSYNAGLNKLCKAVLGYDFKNERVPSDCLNGAKIQMCIVLHVLEHQPKIRIVIQESEMDEGRLQKLYFHRIPQTVSVEDLKQVIPKKLSCDIREIWRPKIKFGNTYMIFKSSNDANKAFDMLKGPLTQDSYGRPQKSLSVAVTSRDGNVSKASVKVRKMLCSPNEHMRSKISVQVSWENGPENAKRIKLMDERDDDCSHLEELELMRNQLKRKIAEVQTLQKIISDLQG